MFAFHVFFMLVMLDAGGYFVFFIPSSPTLSLLNSQLPFPLPYSTRFHASLSTSLPPHFPSSFFCFFFWQVNQPCSDTCGPDICG